MASNRSARHVGARALSLILASLLALSLAPAPRAAAGGGGLPSLSISNVKLMEGDEGKAKAVFTVSLSSGGRASVRFATVDGSAVAGSDYLPASGKLSFDGQHDSKRITVKVLGDPADEPKETFIVKLSKPLHATIADATGVGTIRNDDNGSGIDVSVSVDDASVTEGDAGTTDANFNVTLSGATGMTVTVQYATADGTATAGSDYNATSGTLTFSPGATSQQVTVQVDGDTAMEPNETFTVNLSNPTNANIGVSGYGLGTIADDDQPSISISNATVTEGNTGTVNAVFNVTLSAVSASTVTVQYVTADGTATAGSDYNATSGTLTFSPGATSQQIIVQVVGDTASEVNETYSVNLSNPTNANIGGSGYGLGTIADNDTVASPSISIKDVTVTEGNSGTLNAVFNVTLSASSASIVTVDYTTANGSATAPADYIAVSGTLTFNPGETSKQIVVQVVGDTLIEPNETYSVNLSNATNANIGGSGFGLGTIVDNDTVASPSLTINNVTVTEGNSGTVNAVFNVTLSASSASIVTVDYTTANGSATAPADYIAVSGTLTFNPGETSKQIVVQVAGDTVIEVSETYSVNLSNPTNATIADGTGLGTITDNDTVSISINNVTVTEGNSGTLNAVFNVTLSAPSASIVTVDYTTANGSATAGSDYNAVSGTLTFAPGEVSKQIIVQIVGDLVVEVNETYSVNLSNPTNATIAGSGFGLGTINNND